MTSYKTRSVSSETTKSQTSQDRPRHSRIKKGTACNNCRALKIKCDGVRPKCGPCTKFKRSLPCECTTTRSNPELEAEIRHLKERIRELQHNSQTSTSSRSPSEPPVYLRDPYAQPGDSEASQEGDAYSDIRFRASGLEKVEINFEPMQRHIFLNTFISNASRVQYCLDTQHLLDPTLVSPGLMACVYLWGLALSQTPPNHFHWAEEPLLQRALELNSIALLPCSDPPLHSVIEAIQCHILLSKYLFYAGRWDMARTHSACAATLVAARRLYHKGTEGREPREIQAFWQVLALEQGQTLAMQSISDGEMLAPILDVNRLYVDVCWPDEDPSPWANNQLSRGNIIHSFLTGLDQGGLSRTALRIKSILLFYHLAITQNRRNSGSQNLHSHPVVSAIGIMLSQTAEADATTRSLVHGAMILFHRSSMLRDQWSLQNCLHSARTVAELAPQLGRDNEPSPRWWRDDLIGAVWLEALSVLVWRIRYLRGASQNPMPSAEEKHHFESLHQLLSCLEHCESSGSSAIMVLQSQKARDMTAFL